MSKISDATRITLYTLQGKVGERIRGCAYLEEAAQKFTDVVYEEFEDSIVLVRLFAAIPFQGSAGSKPGVCHQARRFGGDQASDQGPDARALSSWHPW